MLTSSLGDFWWPEKVNKSAPEAAFPVRAVGIGLSRKSFWSEILMMTQFCCTIIEKKGMPIFFLWVSMS